MRPKDDDGVAKSASPDQTAQRAVWSGAALFAQTHLPHYLESLPSYYYHYDICLCCKWHTRCKWELLMQSICKSRNASNYFWRPLVLNIDSWSCPWNPRSCPWHVFLLCFTLLWSLIKFGQHNHFCSWQSRWCCFRAHKNSVKTDFLSHPFSPYRKCKIWREKLGEANTAYVVILGAIITKCKCTVTYLYPGGKKMQQKAKSCHILPFPLRLIDLRVI